MCWRLSGLRHVPSTIWAAAICLAIFGGLFALLWRRNRHGGSFFFDPQDLVAAGNKAGRKLPVSAATGTFAPLLGHYNDVTKLLITVAAASIAFGGGQSPSKGILIAKVVLAFAILYGVSFAALLLFFYDDYCPVRPLDVHVFAFELDLHGIVLNKICRSVAPTPSGPVRAHVNHVSDLYAESGANLGHY